MSRGGRIDRILDSIPGYAGYRDKERRRDSDRVVREKLALEYGQLAERLGRLATTLAQERNIAVISLVDRPHKRLVSFIDRIRTASYGYSPLFSDAPVQADALDQLAAFDRSLADATESIATQISALEAGNPRDPSYKALSQELTSTIEALHDRFDKRHQILHSGEAAPHADVLALLGTSEVENSALAYRLHEGEAVAYGGLNYSVIGRVSGESGSVSWRSFQLRGGGDDKWLHSTPDAQVKPLWLTRVNAEPGGDSLTMSVNGESYTQVSSHEGAGQVIGTMGDAANQPVRFGQYERNGGDRVLVVYDWPSGRLALEGIEVDPRDIQIFSRER